ncbi:MAG TPA: hypothetical protein VHS31_15520 [Tepidisphaeraceae bacterium]|jgi:hypothetical protein|nr:hypothetical protein [Tepidisphaeraceae bacterium]
MLSKQIITVAAVLMCCTTVWAADEVDVSIVNDPAVAAPAAHGMDWVIAALKAKNQRVEIVDSTKGAKGKIVLIAGVIDGKGAAAEVIAAQKLDLPSAKESLLIRHITIENKPAIVLAGADARGLMYAESDLADRIGWSENPADVFSEVKDVKESPDAPERAVSIYTMQRAYFETRLYDAKYWEKFFDTLAKNRFNRFVLICGYENGGFLAPPYPYFFDVDGYPDVRMVGITPEQQKKNLDSLNRTIAMAHDRGIDVTFGIWDHIYRGGVQANGVPGTEDATKKPTPSLVWGVTADNLVPYTKAALTKFLHEVHGIDAIQFRMHDESGLKNSEQAGFWKEIARLMQKEAPNIRFDARAKGLPDGVIDDLVSTGIPLQIDTKVWMEQMGLPFHPTHINVEDQDNRRHGYADMLRYPQQYKIHWRLWNGGPARVLLGGDPEYARRFVETTHLYNGNGFEINEPLCTKMQGQAFDVKPFDLLNSQYKYTDYEFERYWHLFQVFGRIGYDPKTADEVWDREFDKRFGKDAGPHVEKALHEASWILPRIVASIYPYSGFPMTRGWAERQSLGDLPHYANNEGSDIAQFASFQEEADCLLNGKETPKVRPEVTAKWFTDIAKEVDSEISEAEKSVGNQKNPEFVSTITDLKILSCLAKFHAHRIPAAIEYCIFHRTKEPGSLKEAIIYERQAVDAWKELVKSAGDVYCDNMMMGNPKTDLCGSWRDELPELQDDLNKLIQQSDAIAGQNPPTTMHANDLVASQFVRSQQPIEFEHTPIETAPANHDLKVSVRVQSTAGIKWVRLRYRSVNQRLDYSTLDMAPTGQPDEYRATIPADQIPAKWDFMYYIEAMDRNGDGKIYPDLEKQTPYVVVKLQR